MNTYMLDIIPKIQRFSHNFENIKLLTNQHWVVFNDVDNMKVVYIFRANNQILLSKDGKVEKGGWEIVGKNSILIDLKNESHLFNHVFFDELILVLKLDGKEDYTLMINENKYLEELNSLSTIIDFLSQKYLKSLPPIETNYRLIETNEGNLYIDKNRLVNLKGAKVYSNIDASEVPSDGRYKINFIWCIYVKNGIITKDTWF